MFCCQQLLPFPFPFLLQLLPFARPFTVIFMNNQKRRSPTFLWFIILHIYLMLSQTFTTFFFLTETIFKTFGTKKTQFVPTDIHCSDLLSFLRLLYWQLTFVEVDCNKNSDHHFALKQFIQQLQPNGRSFFLNLKCLLLQMLPSVPRSVLSVFCIH